MIGSRDELRCLLARYLFGRGVEVGPGHFPFEIPFGGAEVRFVDRWQPHENRQLFPELGSEAPFVKPDIVANLDTDRLSALPDESQDFVICSHVLEHLAEPVGFICEMHRVVRPGGVVVILLPDRHRTFDRAREPTSLAHLLAEHRSRVTEVDDDHIREFLIATGDPQAAYGSVEIGSEVLDQHRRRSIHVHCWDMSEFVPVLEHGIRELGQRWELADALFTEQGGQESIEFGFVLRRSDSRLSSDVLADRFISTWKALDAAASRAAGAVSATEGAPLGGESPRDVAGAQLVVSNARQASWGKWFWGLARQKVSALKQRVLAGSSRRSRQGTPSGT